MIKDSAHYESLILPIAMFPYRACDKLKLNQALHDNHDDRVANTWNKPHEEALFYDGYGKIEINMTMLAYYRHERIIEDIAEYGQNLLLTTAGGENRSEMYKHYIAMFEPRGVVDIAFKTDEKFMGNV